MAQDETLLDSAGGDRALLWTLGYRSGSHRSAHPRAGIRLFFFSPSEEMKVQGSTDGTYGEQSRQLLEALGDQEKHKLIQVLLCGQQRQTTLAQAAGVSTGNASKAMQQLMSLDLVRRDGPRNAWRVLHRDEIFGLLIAADALSGAILDRRTQEHKETLRRRRADWGSAEDA